MVRPADEELLERLKGTPLTGLSRSLGIEIDEWLPVASSPLPVTLRLTPGRHDVDWTRGILESLGVKESGGLVHLSHGLCLSQKANILMICPRK